MLSYLYCQYVFVHYQSIAKTIKMLHSSIYIRIVKFCKQSCQYSIAVFIRRYLSTNIHILHIKHILNTSDLKFSQDKISQVS